MNATEKINQLISQAKQTAEKAELDFEYASQVLQIKAGRSIDLFGGNAVGRVADIASESRKICDTLYATYQTLVTMLDSECRPLLDQNPDYLAVRDLRNLIKKLNDDSEIQNNFTASLNGQGLGDVVSARYMPSIGSKMIQTFWETKCDTWPGKEEAERAEQKRLILEEARRKVLAGSQMDQEEAKYRKELAEWQEKANAIEKRRAETLDKLMAEAKAHRMEEIQSAYAARQQAADWEKQCCLQEKAKAEAALAAAGVFQFGQKQTAKNTIQAMSQRIAAADAQLNAAAQTYYAEQASLENWLNTQRSSLSQSVNAAHPLPAEPQRPYFIGRDGQRLPAAEIEALRLGQVVADKMRYGVLYSVPDLQQSIPELNNLMHHRVQAIMRRLCDRDQVQRVEENRRVYYRLKD